MKVNENVRETVINNSILISDNTANPSPLGLMGFGMSTVLLNLHNLGLFELSSMVLSVGFFYGGLGQIFAGIMDWKKKNTFGTTAFTSYGLFWISLVSLILLPKMGIASPAGHMEMGFFLLMWGIFTLGMAFATLKLGRKLQVVFFSLAVLFFLLAAGDFLQNLMIDRTHDYELCSLYEG